MNDDDMRRVRQRVLHDVSKAYDGPLDQFQTWTLSSLIMAFEHMFPQSPMYPTTREIDG